MHFSTASIAILSLPYLIDLVLGVGRILPNPITDVTNVLYRHSSYVDQKVRLDPHDFLNHQIYHQRNVASDPINGADPISGDSLISTSSTSTTSPISVAMNGTPPLSKAVVAADPSTNWNNQTETACMTALDAMHGIASNLAGMAACYNVRSFDNTTGVFQADLRIYRISPLAGAWTQLKTQAVSAGLSYNGASVASGSMNGKRDTEMLSWSPVQRGKTDAATLKRAAGASPSKLQDLTFIGKIHDDMLAQIGNKTFAQALLIPNISVSGTAQNGTPISTKLSSNDASFLNGVFADQTLPPAGIAATAPAAASASGTFVLPGTTLGIFPTGLIITGAWTLLFVATVGYGTVGRIQFRDSYRRRIKRMQTVGLRTI